MPYYLLEPGKQTPYAQAYHVNIVKPGYQNGRTFKAYLYEEGVGVRMSRDLNNAYLKTNKLGKDKIRFHMRNDARQQLNIDVKIDDIEVDDSLDSGTLILPGFLFDAPAYDLDIPRHIQAMQNQCYTI